MKIIQKALWQGRRTFEKLDERLLNVRIDMGLSYTERDVDLRFVNPQPQRVVIKAPLKFPIGFCVLGVAGIALGMLSPDYSDARMLGFVSGGICLFITPWLFLKALKARADHFYFFDRTTGRPVIPMLYNKPNPMEFESFVSWLTRQINKNQNNNG